MTDQRLMQYTAAVGALVASGPLVAEPQPIPQTRLDAVESQTTPGFFFLSGTIEVTGNGINQINVSGLFDFNNDEGYISFNGTGGTYVAQDFLAGGYVVQAFAPDDEIDGALNFTTSSVNLYSRNWSSPPDGDYEDFLEQRGFVGLQFPLFTGGMAYACMEAEVDLSNGFTVFIRGGIHEDQAAVPVACPDFLADEIFGDRFSDD